MYINLNSTSLPLYPSNASKSAGSNTTQQAFIYQESDNETFTTHNSKTNEPRTPVCKQQDQTTPASVKLSGGCINRPIDDGIGTSNQYVHTTQSRRKGSISVNNTSKKYKTSSNRKLILLRGTRLILPSTPSRDDQSNKQTLIHTRYPLFSSSSFPLPPSPFSPLPSSPQAPKLAHFANTLAHIHFHRDIGLFWCKEETKTYLLIMAKPSCFYGCNDPSFYLCRNMICIETAV